MEKSPGVMWAGSFDEQLFQLIQVFTSAGLFEEARLVSLPGLPFDLTKTEPSCYKPGPLRSPCFDKHTVETLCNATINVEDAVICEDAAGNESFHPTSILTEVEKEQIFSSVRFWILAQWLA